MNNKSDPIVIIESRGAHCVAANGYRDEDDWLDAVAAYAIQQRSDLDIQTQADAVAYLSDKRNVSVQIITQADYLDVDGWDPQVAEAAALLGWGQAVSQFKLNRTLTQYSHVPAEQKAYEAMQQVGFKIAEVLMTKPRGTMSSSIMGHAYWVSPVAGSLELFCTPDYKTLDALANVHPLSGFEGQGASDLDEIRVGMEEWLGKPAFIVRDAELLDALANGTADQNARQTPGFVPGK